MARTTRSIADGQLSGHDYSAVVNKGRWQGEHYRQLELLSTGCPTPDETYAPASVLLHVMLQGIKLGTRWLLRIAHETNRGRVRTLMGFD